MIENQVLQVPGSTATYDLRAQDVHGAFGRPMLSLLQGHYPAGPGQVAVTPGVARQFDLAVGHVWHQGGVTRTVTGIVQNPQSLLDEFALLVPGQVHAPTSVTVLFDAPSVPPGQIGPNVVTPQTTAANAINPDTIVLTLATVGMLLIALVSVGGFTVLAQRRLRALGMLAAIGATDRNVRLVVRANGLVVGVAGTLLGAVLGLAVWLAYRPRVVSSSHHVIAPFALPWAVIGPAMGLAVLATYLAASRPARAVTKIPVVAALAGRPAPPKRVRRSALPGVVVLAVAFGLLTFAGSRPSGSGQGTAMLCVVGGFIALVAAVVLLAPMCLALLGRLARHTPVSARLALRDLARYRARSGSALAAISLGVLIAVMISIVSAARYANVLDYAGPNLTSSQLIVYTPNGRVRAGAGRPRPIGFRAGHRRADPVHAHGREPDGVRAGLAPGDRAGHHHRFPAARRAGPELVRSGVRGHPGPAAVVRDRAGHGPVRHGHPHHAAWPVRVVEDAAGLRQLLQQAAGAGLVPLPAGQLPGRSGHAAGQRAAVRHVRARTR